MPALLLLLIGGLLDTVGDIIFKFWIEKNNNLTYIIGIVVYVLGLMFLIESYKTQNIAVASVVFVMFNIITLSLVSWLYFKEPLSVFQIVGVLLAFASIFLLETGGK